MKIRNGFVSNSSSSSFIISAEHFPTLRKLATYMINKQIEDRDDYDSSDNDWSKQYIEQNKEYIERLNKLDENQSISFPSCNYDTYIKRVGDVYLVATCNNTDWELCDYTTGLTDNAKEALKNLHDTYPKNSKEREYIQEILDTTNGEDFYHIGKDYYSLSKEILGIETFDDCPNRDKNNYEYDHYLWDTVRYGKICPKCNPVFKRKDKLDIINQIAKED
jgi:hypothetical protein